ncbi:MAG: hypothetical protein FE78DRAFT_32669 [Acidomyces sp. 'richmondensis']|nr:MAG: hypothetical protein FE78DRAFT_32669 [Acidomyces sp. 'richmondensis']
MPSTPEPHSTRTRARTPPTPLHGPQHDTYEPYSPRRSSRAASHRNPYGSSSANLNRSTPPPPTTTKRARFAVGTTQLNSPPASPRHHKTPRNNRPTAVKATNSLSDSDNNTPTIGRRRVAAHHSLDPTTMLPTPSKTPQTQQKKKKNATVLRSTARILHFPSVPGDGERRCRVGFELDSSDEDTTVSDGKNKKKRKEKEKSIPIYTDPNARVPERDEREVNPFLGPAVVGGASSSSRKKRGIARGKEEEMEEEEMEERVRRKEGMVYVL